MVLKTLYIKLKVSLYIYIEIIVCKFFYKLYQDIKSKYSI